METAGEAGSFMLGNTDGPDCPAGGADSGQLGPCGVGGRFVSMGAGFEPFSFCLSLSSLSLFSSRSSQPQLRSDLAVDGGLSTCRSFSFSEFSDSVVPVLPLLLWLSVLLAVLVRLDAAFPVCGGEAKFGEASDMLFRKSR